MEVSKYSSDKETTPRQDPLMVAELASPRPTTAIADNRCSPHSNQPSPLAAQGWSDRRNYALTQLEKTLEGCHLADDEQLNIWTAFQEMLDDIDEQPLDEQPGDKQSLEEQFDTCPTWNETLIVFGQEIQRIRQTQKLSLEQIHFKTQVPLYQLRAIESGSVAQLPEEIFVRGFLTRICAQLGAEGQALLAQLPAIQPGSQNILADWQQAPQAGSNRVQVLHLRPGHLYVGYVALLAGATGGLTLSFQETAQLTSDQHLDQTVQNQSNQSATKVKLNPVQRVAQFAFGSDVARPEQSAPETE